MQVLGARGNHHDVSLIDAMRIIYQFLSINFLKVLNKINWSVLLVSSVELLYECKSGRIHGWSASQGLVFLLWEQPLHPMLLGRGMLNYQLCPFNSKQLKCKPETVA